MVSVTANGDNSVQRSLGLYIKSVLCTIWFRMHRFESTLVGCEGQLPVLYGGGTVIIGGQLMVRSRVARCELGAKPNARLLIGKGVFINQGATIVASHDIQVGNDAQIGDFAAIYDTNYHRIDPDHPVKYAPVVIGANVWLGRGVLVLPGSTIGDHTVVSAGSVVVGNLPSRVLAAGNPARVMRELRIPDGWRRG
jgi:acetyltransferase-like isoleucine patch superfamily enzyme